MRLIFAFAVGVFFDLVVFRDAFSFGDRDAISPRWPNLVTIGSEADIPRAPGGR
jgi:hypothetical protein